MASWDWSSRPEVDLRSSPHCTVQRIHLCTAKVHIRRLHQRVVAESGQRKNVSVLTYFPDPSTLHSVSVMYKNRPDRRKLPVHPYVYCTESRGRGAPIRSLYSVDYKYTCQKPYLKAVCTDDKSKRYFFARIDYCTVYNIQNT